MADALETTETTTEETTSTEGGATTEAAPAATETTEDEWGDPEALPEDQDLFPRTYVESLRDREAKYRIKARDLHSKVDEFGGLDAVQAAVEMQRNLGTDDGVISMFIESGRALGLGIKELEALFGQQSSGEVTVPDGTGSTTDLTGLGDDDTITVAQARRMFEEVANQQALVAQQEQLVAGAQTAVHSTLDELKVTESADIDRVLVLGQKYLADNDYDPAHIAAAVRRGFEDFNKETQQRVEAYLRSKKTATETVPSSTSASTPGSTTLPEPKNSEEARKRARQRLRLSGESA